MQNTPTGAAHAAPQRNQRIVALDGLRALAIAGVVLYHLRPSRLTGGFLGVTLFFTLSGYLATKSIMRATARDGFSYPRYICRRIARMMPPIVVTIALTAVATYTGTATSSYVKGYTVTADYTGTVSRIVLNKVRYVAIFEGKPLIPILPDEPEDTAPVQFNWLAIAIPFGLVALVGAGTGAALLIKRRHEAAEEDAE